MSTPDNKNTVAPDDTVINITPVGEAKSSEYDGLKSRTPFMDLMSPFKVGDESQGKVLSNDAKVKIAMAAIAASKKLVTGIGYKSPTERRKEIDDKRKKKDADKSKKPPDTGTPPVNSETGISNKIVTLKKDYDSFSASYETFLNIGVKALALLAEDKTTYHQDDIERLNTLSEYVNDIKKTIDELIASSYTNPDSALKIAEKIENPNSVKGATHVATGISWPWDAKKAKKLEQKEQTESPQDPTQRTFHDSLLGPKGHPEEYKKVMSLSGGLKTNLEGLQKQFKRFQTYYSGFIQKLSGIASKIDKNKIKADEASVENLTEKLDQIKNGMDGLKKLVFSNPQKNALSLIKTLHNKDRWKYKNIFEPSAKPQEEQVANPAEPAQEEAVPAAEPAVPKAEDK